MLLRYIGLPGAAALALGAASAEQPAGAQRAYQLQIGPHALAPYTQEEPFINIAKTWNGEWRAEADNGEVMTAAELRTLGVIDPESGMPLRSPEGVRAFIGPRILDAANEYPDHYADHYVMEWKGDAYGFLTRQPRDLQTRLSAKKLSFAVRFDDAGFRGLRFSRIRGAGLKDLVVYRRKNKDLVRAGKIWNPEHVDHLRQYDIIRTMDYQAANASPVTRFDQVATVQDAGWGRSLQITWPAPPRYGAPFEILFDLAKETDAALWLIAPTMLGAPFDLADPALRRDDRPDRIDADKLRDRAKENAADILDSNAWEEFAENVVTRMIASGYPADRPLYFELGNELWNNAGWFSLHTQYARGIGESINPDWGTRQGYGVLSARWAAAFERALQTHGRKQNITYVLSGQTGWPGSTKNALQGHAFQLEAMRIDRATVLANTGVAITSYHNCANGFVEARFGDPKSNEARTAFEKAIAEDGEALKDEARDYCLNSPASTRFTKAWIIARWKAHDLMAKRGGVRLIGAYEGGSHETPHRNLLKSRTIKDWWTDYHWGVQGADVVRQINLDLIDLFPGVILSNYTGMSEVGGHPWNDGHYDENTEMQQMWREFGRPANSN